MKNKRLLFMILALALMCIALSACDFIGGLIPGGDTATTTTTAAPVTTTAPPPVSSVTTTAPAPSLEVAELEFEGATFTYDGQPKSIAVDGLPEGATVSYYIGDSTTAVDAVALTNAGTYTVKAVVVLPAGYEPCEEMEATLTINKAEIDLDITFADASVVENGQPQSIAYTGTLPTGVTATYCYLKGGKTVAATDVVAPGEYTVLLDFAISDDLKSNYNVPAGKSAKLTIVAKADYDLDGVTLSGATTIVYGTATPVFTLENLPAGLTQGAITIDGAPATDALLAAGTHEVSIAYVNTNAAYNDPTATYTFDLVVEQADIPGWDAVKFEGKQAQANGEDFTIAVEGLEGLTVTVAVKYLVNGEPVDVVSYKTAGTYNAVAKFTVADANYKTPADMTATLTITVKKVYDLTNVALSGSTTITYGDDTPNFVLGNLPAGLTQGAITIDGNAVPAGKLNAGTYKVSIALVNGNTAEYEDPSYPYTFDLLVEQADIPGWDAVRFESLTKPNNGNTHTIAVTGLDGLTVTVAVEYLVNGAPVDAVAYFATGTYNAVAKFTVADANYKTPADMTAVLSIIEMSAYDFDGVTVNGATEITFGDDTPSFSLNGLHTNLAVGTIVITDADGEVVTGVLDAGVYTVTFTFTHSDENYVDPDPYAFTLTVNQKQAEVPAGITIVWDYEDRKDSNGDFISFESGNTYTVKLTEATVAALEAAGIEVGEYTGNVADSVGEYTATVTLISADGNTVYPTQQLTWALRRHWSGDEGPEI